MTLARVTETLSRQLQGCILTLTQFIIVIYIVICEINMYLLPFPLNWHRGSTSKICILSGVCCKLSWL